MATEELERIRAALDLPASADIGQIEARITELKGMEEWLKTKLPPEEWPELKVEEEVTLVSELQKMQYEPLLSVEKKLISWSIVLGIICLILFVWISYTFFPGAH